MPKICFLLCNEYKKLLLQSHKHFHIFFFSLLEKKHTTFLSKSSLTFLPARGACMPHWSSHSPLAVAYACHCSPAVTRDIELARQIGGVYTTNNECKRRPREPGRGLLKNSGITLNRHARCDANHLFISPRRFAIRFWRFCFGGNFFPVPRTIWRTFVFFIFHVYTPGVFVASDASIQ